MLTYVSRLSIIKKKFIPLHVGSNQMICYYFSCQFVVDYNVEKYQIHSIDPDVLVDWDAIQLIVRKVFSVCSCDYCTLLFKNILNANSNCFLFIITYSTSQHTNSKTVQYACTLPQQLR